MTIFDFFPSFDFSRVALAAQNNGAILVCDESINKIERESQPLADSLRHSHDHFDYLVAWYCKHLKDGGQTHMDMEQFMFERRFAERRTA